MALTTVQSGMGGIGSAVPGTAGNVLTSNGTAWVSQAAAAGFSGATINSPSASALTLTNTSTQCQIVQFTSVANSIINLPNATTLTTEGAPIYRLINDTQCSASVFVRNASGTILATIAVKGIVDVTLEDNSTSAGSWVFSTVNYNATPAFFDAASPATATVSLGSTPIGGASGAYGIQLSDSSYVFAVVTTSSANFQPFLRVVGATLTGSTFSFGTPVSSASISTEGRSGWWLAGFRLNSTTAVFDCRTTQDNGTTAYGRTNSIVVTLSGTTVTVGSVNANNAPVFTTSTGNPFDYVYTAVFGPVKCRISDTAFATVYQTSTGSTASWYLNGSGNLNCTITTVSGTTQTNGTAVTIAANVGMPTSICSHTDNAFALSYYTNGTVGTSTAIRKAVAATVSGTVPTFGSPVNVDSTSVPIFKGGACASFNAVAFSATKVLLSFPNFVSGTSSSLAESWFGVCTISGTTITFVPNSIFQVQYPANEGYYSFEFINSTTFTQYTRGFADVFKYSLTASDIPYYLEKFTIRSDVQSGSDLPAGSIQYAMNYTQGTSVAVSYNANENYSGSNFFFTTTKVTAP
jgi:hypothetical protein